MSILPRIKLALTGLYWRYLHPHKRLFLSLAFVVVGAVLLARGPTVSAEGLGTASAPMNISFVPDAILKILSQVLLLITRFFLSIAMFILSFIVEIGSYNGYLSSQAVTIGWVTVRDVTNMGFVIILLIIAFGTILGLEQYEWKKLLVKFVMAAILVNFSRIICGVIIDVAQVVMTTFVNGIAATAGGNLINAFNLNDIQKLSPDTPPGGLNPSGVFIASVAGITFSAMVMATMGVYLAMMIARMVVLWVLIVLSPLAFVLSVVPQTQKYASQWWSEFGSNVVTGPVLLFFLWLSFVTVGSGNVHQQISDSPGVIKLSEADATKSAGTDISSGITEAMKWNSMASFAIAIGMLMVGAKAAQQLGGVGGAWAGGAIDFGKKVATVASGVAAARWAGGKAKQGAIAAAKGLALAAYHVTPAASIVKRVKNWGERQYHDFQGRYKYGVPFERRKATGTADEHGMVDVETYNPETGKEEKRKVKAGEEYLKIVKPKGMLERMLHGRAVKEIASEKMLEKTKKFTETKKDILTSLTQGVPAGLFQKEVEGEDATDRVYSGVLKQLKSRSAAKTEEYEGVGAKMTGEIGRLQYPTAPPKEGKPDQRGKLVQKEEKQVDELSRHKIRAERFALDKKALEAESRGRLLGSKERKGEAIEGAALTAAQQAAHLEEVRVGAEEEKLKREFAETEHGKHEIEEVAGAELGAEAAKAFVDKIKQEKLGAIFKGATAELKSALEKVKAGAKVEEVISGIKNPASLAVFAGMQASYFKDRVAGTSRDLALDEAENMWNFERKGNDTPAAAFKKAMKKEEGDLIGVERERAVSMVSDSMMRLFHRQTELKPGEELEVDQLASFMTGIQHLVKNGWSDDLLSRLVEVARSSNKGEYKGTTREAEAKNIEHIVNDVLGWGGYENGKMMIDNTSSEKRTNDLHRLLGFGGNSNLLLSENAVLLHQQAQKGKGVERGYSDSATDLAEQVRAAQAKALAAGGALDVKALVKDLGLEEIGKSLGWSEERMARQLETFTKTFVDGTASAKAATTKFVGEIKKYGHQGEVLTEMKTSALATTHIDDGGHQIFNMQEGFSHGMLSNDAMKFMLSDWIKVEGGSRMRNLKSHALGNMDEDHGTLHSWDADRIAATYAGVDSKVKLESQDVRVQRHLLKHAASEKLVKDTETGALVVGSKKSVLVEKKFGGDEERAKIDVARDWAVAFKNGGAKALLGLLGTNSTTFEDGIRGKFKLNLFGDSIEDAEKLTNWINDHIKTNVVIKGDNRKIEELNIKDILSSASVTNPRPRIEGEEDDDEGRTGKG